MTFEDRPITYEPEPESYPNEATALLSASPKKRRRTPLDHGQISIVLLMQLAEPFTSQSIYPYVNELVSHLDIVGGDMGKVGYYAGMIESLFFATEAMTVLQWSRLSDHIGRKPVLMIGLFGSAVSMLCFGFSRTFWALVISRCLTGLLNGNVGVMKSTMGDLTDSSNRAEGFAMMPVVWATGATLGPLIGGTLARPHDQWPSVFKSVFWQQYPYVLPCIGVFTIIMFILIIAVLFFKETLPSKKRQLRPVSQASQYSATSTLCDEALETVDEKPLPVREVLTYPVVLSISNYVTLAFLNIAFSALFPLFCSMPLEIGGLGMSPAKIGYILAGYGFFTGVFQFFWFATIVRKLGEKKMYTWGVACFLPVFALFPVMSFLAKSGHCIAVYLLMTIVLALCIVMDLAYGAVFMYVTSSSPNKASLGTTNGLSQTTVSIARAIGPATATSLFSLSVERNIMGGYGVYFFFFVCAVASVILGNYLPDKLWDDVGDDTVEE